MNQLNNIIKIKTSKVAAQVIAFKYGYNFQIDKSIHKDFIKTLSLPTNNPSRLLDTEGEICFRSPIQFPINENTGAYFHQVVMNDMSLYVLAQVEIGIKIKEAIDNWYEKYDLDDYALQIDTAKKHFYRFRIKEEKRREIAETSKNLVKNFGFWTKDMNLFVPPIFVQRTKFFIAFLTDFNHIIEAAQTHLGYSITEVIANKQKTEYVKAKKILCYILYYGLEMTQRDVATYLEVQKNAVQYYIQDVNKNINLYAKDLYLIFQETINKFDDDRAAIQKTLLEVNHS